jgi:hypothetical protein
MPLTIGVVSGLPEGSADMAAPLARSTPNATETNSKLVLRILYTLL